MSRNTSFVPGEYYHIYNRGVDSRQVFMDAHDYARAELLLYLANSEYKVDIDNSLKKGLTFLELWNVDRRGPRVEIGAWCLMPNHFHVLIRAVDEKGISAFMKTFATAYSMYFNARHGRGGSLMQGAYKSVHIDDDRYLQYLFSYVHLNPVKLVPGESEWKERGIQDAKRASTFLDSFHHSSLKDYASPNSRREYAIIAPEAFPWKFNSTQTMSDEITDWLHHKKVRSF